MQMAAPTAAICIGPSYGLVPVSWVPTMHVHGAHSVKGQVPPSPWLTFWLNMTQGHI